VSLAIAQPRPAEDPGGPYPIQSAHSSSSAAESTFAFTQLETHLWRSGRAIPDGKHWPKSRRDSSRGIEKLGHPRERLVGSEIGLDDRAHQLVRAFNHFVGRQNAYRQAPRGQRAEAGSLDIQPGDRNARATPNAINAASVLNRRPW